AGVLQHRKGGTPAADPSVLRASTEPVFFNTGKVVGRVRPPAWKACFNGAGVLQHRKAQGKQPTLVGKADSFNGAGVLQHRKAMLPPQSVTVVTTLQRSRCSSTPERRCRT